jgi:hypothetical protein
MAGNDAKGLRLAQSRKFADAARSLECDESEERFDAAPEKIGAHKPPTRSPGKTKSRVNPDR